MICAEQILLFCFPNKLLAKNAQINTITNPLCYVRASTQSVMWFLFTASAHCL